MLTIRSAQSAWLCLVLACACAPTEDAYFSDSPAPNPAETPESSPNEDPGNPGGSTALGNSGTPPKGGDTGGSSGSGSSEDPIGSGATGGTGGVEENGGGTGASEGGATNDGAVCGNGIIETGESCDDGARENGDGCSKDCVVRCLDLDRGAVLGPNGSCYEFGDVPNFWVNAREQCSGKGAHLVTISSLDENTFLAKRFAQEFWIGANDGKRLEEEKVGAYKWVTGEPFDYNAWGPNEPSASAIRCERGGDRCYEHCAVATQGVWSDIVCVALKPYVCEWDAPGKRQ